MKEKWDQVEGRFRVDGVSVRGETVVSNSLRQVRLPEMRRERVIVHVPTRKEIRERRRSPQHRQSLQRDSCLSYPPWKLQQHQLARPVHAGPSFPQGDGLSLPPHTCPTPFPRASLSPVTLSPYHRDSTVRYSREDEPIPVPNGLLSPQPCITTISYLCPQLEVQNANENSPLYSS